MATTQRQVRAQLAAGTQGPPSALLWKLLLTLGLLAIAAMAAFVFLVALGGVEASVVGLGALDDYLAAGGVRQLTVIGASGGVGVLALALALRRPGAARSSTSGRHLVTMSERGVVMVNTRSVSALAMLAARQQSGVLGAEVLVRGAGASPVRLIVRAVVIPGAQLSSLGEAVQTAARDAVERLAGLTVQDVHVELKLAIADDLERVLE